MQNDIAIARAAEVIESSRSMIALTGAGISVESGIPDFRSANGLWEKYDPAIYATIQTFKQSPERSWKMIFDMSAIIQGAKPNPGHRSLAELEDMGLLKTLITQNIDNLHQEAGSRDVIEYHGNGERLECLSCGREYSGKKLIEEGGDPPRCLECGKILKPAVIFFGEMIPPGALTRSQSLAESADVVLVIGTSASVYPAASIPIIAKKHNATVIEFNIEETGLTAGVTDIFIQGQAGTTLPRLLDILRKGATQ